MKPPSSGPAPLIRVRLIRRARWRFIRVRIKCQKPDRQGGPFSQLLTRALRAAPSLTLGLLTLLLTVHCSLLTAFAQDTPADNWSQFRGNHSLTGVSQSTVPN